MARKMIKWLGIGIGMVAGVLLIAAIVLVIMTNRKSNVVYTFETANLSIPTDEASIAEGERLVTLRNCTGCHGEDLAGNVLIEDALFGTYIATNLTGGQNSVTANYTPTDWDRAIRHGVGTNGKALWVMPSFEYNQISDRDLELMIAYLESIPAVDQAEPYPAPKVGPLAMLLLNTGQIPFLSAETIDHDTPAQADVVAEVSAEYGAYLATTCQGCHQANFSGGPMPGTPPEHPPAANLTPAGHLANWTQDDFIKTLRTGVTPEGKTLNPDYMPWTITQRMTDDELAALWLYFNSLPPVTSGS